MNPSPENVYQMLVGYRAGDMWAPQLALTEALQTEGRHFIDCVEHGKPPTTEGTRAFESSACWRRRHGHCPKRVRWFGSAPR